MDVTGHLQGGLFRFRRLDRLTIPPEDPVIQHIHQGMNMSGIIGALFEGIADFVTDVWLLRRQRSARGRPEKAWQDDAADMVVLDAWAIGLGIAAFAVAALMFFLLKLPLWLCVAPIVAVGIYVGYRWMALARA